ncbi:helix-turn-helix transcriptional regulator [Streptomyces sp. NPDC000594]|uniref:helix-turn-helix transcriptional regulator n=1 Tax=Streptomyces sp. NPDC000594 TaxID=3154261 RepID=UPI00331BB5EB
MRRVTVDGRLARELGFVAVQQADADDRGRAFSQLIAPVVPHDAFTLVGSDPAIGLGFGSFSFWHGFPTPLVKALVRHRHQQGGPWHAGAVARGAALTHVVTVGDPTLSPADRLRAEVLAAHGALSELRLLLRDERGVWGMLALIRSTGGLPFDPDDARLAALLAPALIVAVRRHVLAGPLLPAAPALPAGVITMGPDHRVRTVSPQAGAWLELFRARGRRVIPEWMPDVFLMALSLSTRSPEHRRNASAPLVCSPPAVCGRWIVCQGQTMGVGGDIALVIQAPVGDLVLPSFCAWYGITPRERDVVDALRTGAATQRIAHRLDLSVHTVNDHLKAVFRKTGADGRDELIAALGH